MMSSFRVQLEACCPSHIANPQDCTRGDLTVEGACEAAWISLMERRPCLSGCLPRRNGYV